MQTPEEHLGALIAAYEDANREDRALCEPSVRVKVNQGALAAADLIRARDAEVAARALRESADKLNRDRRIHDASCGESPAQTKEQAGRDHGVTIGLRQAVRHLDERAAAIERGEP